MSSAVDICNIALSHLGADAIVASISPADGSVESGHCARFYPIARRAAIEMAKPSFARARALLAEITNVSLVWAYAYARPTSCIKPLRILTLDLGLTVFTQDDTTIESDEDRSAKFELEADTIFTNEPEATLVYLTDVVDTTKFTPMFEMGLGLLLASHLTGPLIKGKPGIALGNSLYERAVAALTAAATSNANSSATVHGMQIPTHLRNR